MLFVFPFLSLSSTAACLTSMSSLETRRLRLDSSDSTGLNTNRLSDLCPVLRLLVTLLDILNNGSWSHYLTSFGIILPIQSKL